MVAFLHVQAGSLVARRLVLAALVVAPLLVFGPQLPGSPAWDDIYLVRDHPAIHDPQGWRDILTSELWHGIIDEGSQFYHPIPMLTVWAQAQFSTSFGLLRFTNLVIHIANVLLFFRVGVLLGLRPITAAWIAMIFALQPLATEPVMWVTGRHDTLAVTFLLIALIVLPFAKVPTLGRALVGTAACLGAFLCKEAYFIGPLLLAVALILRPPASAPRSRRARALLIAVPFVAPVLGLAIRHALSISSYTAQLGASFLEHLQNYGTIIAGFLGYTLLLTAGTTTRVFRPLDMGTALVVVLVAAVASIGVSLRALLWARTHRNAAEWNAGDRASLGSLWFLVALAPHVVAMPILGTWGNRYGYFPSLGLLIAVGSVLERLVLRLPVPGRRAALGLLAVPVAIAALRTTALARTWRDEVSLFARDVAEEPDNPVALHHLATAYEAIGGCPKSIELLERAATIAPTWWRGAHDAAGCLIRLGRFEDALPYARRAHRLNPTHLGSIQNRALAQMRSGRLDAARKTLARGLELHPQSADLRRMQGEIDHAPSTQRAPP